MDERQALAAFAALGQEHRLRVVRALVIAGPEGLAAGALAAEVGVASTNLSFHTHRAHHIAFSHSSTPADAIYCIAANWQGRCHRRATEARAAHVGTGLCAFSPAATCDMSVG